MRKSTITIGETYHNLKVIERAGTRTNKTPIWKCQCTLCGSYSFVSSEHLKDNSTNSCGCLRRVIMREKKQRVNTFKVIDDIVVGYDTQGNSFIIDLEDLDRVKQYYWSVDKRGYVRNVKNQIALHRFILNAPDGFVVDHKNHNTSDNRKCNIWVCTQSDNMYNQRRFHGGKEHGVKTSPKENQNQPKRGVERKKKLW